MQLLFTLDIDDQKYDDYVIRQYKSYLNAAEFERYFKISDNNKKRMFLISRGELKCKLGAMLDIIPQDISFSYTTCGKPYITGSDLHFSLSHTSNYLAIVIANYQIGIDIEKSVARDFARISKRIFSTTVINSKGFYKLWTAHEAILKCDGNSSVFSKNALSIIDNSVVSDSHNIVYTNYNNCVIAIATRRSK